ncbi:hypothetical protein GCM10027512_21050 [Chromohalobacter beijerinckii]
MAHNVRRATCWIVAGPNGAGKTTFALNYLPHVANCTRFINADLIAAGLSPLAPERELLAASRIFLQEIEEAIGISVGRRNLYLNSAVQIGKFLMKGCLMFSLGRRDHDSAHT